MEAEMGLEIIMPQLGETVAEGKIVSWFKQVGDTVRAGDRLFEVETDKVTIDVEAIDAGTIREIRVGDGETAPVGVVVAVLEGGAAPQSVPEAPAGAPASASVTAAPASTAVPSKPRPMSVQQEVVTAKGLFGKASRDGIRITPLARRLISQGGHDLGELVAASKAKGLSRITERELNDLIGIAPRQSGSVAGAATVSPPALNALKPLSLGESERDEVVAFSTIRQKTADRLAENWRTIPHVFQALEVDFTAIDAVRKDRKQTFKAEHQIALTFLPFITRAVSIVLREFPDINARTDGTRLLRCKDVNVGIAVDLDHKGLVVPVLRNANELTVPGIAKAIGRLVERARAGKLGADDMAGGTYSITNNGAFGTQFTAPIINAPQVAILSTDAIRLRPAVISTTAGDLIAPRMLGMIGQSFDHRAFDGAYSAAFLSRLKSVLETRKWEQEFA
jgi:pyruvate/2-oxoglutarate dehydrogenase complex dihydrolipoamide acyltransferase (E2) component